jgi:predicted RNase H-like HicB family nuclease
MGADLEHLDHYSRFVQWSEEDHAWIGYCFDLFPYGGVCHGSTSSEAFALLSELIEEEIHHLIGTKEKLPEPKQAVFS